MTRKASILVAFLLLFSSVVLSKSPGERHLTDGLKLIRGPYLQSGTSTSMIIKWQTNNPTSSKVVFGTNPDQLDQIKFIETKTKDHEVLIEDLNEHTKYYYTIGNHKKLFFEDDPTYYFITSPRSPYNETVRIWAIGDFGTGDYIPERVRKGYMKYSRDKHTDVWLMLGDIGYFNGSQSEFQRGIFDGVYKGMMRNTVIWPTPGNHDLRSADSRFGSGPYYNIFTVPKNGEAGGIPSGKEAYYSFNYGDIHFISMDSEDTPRDKNGVMANWLRTDLENDDHNWKIAYFHHPVYTKGSHDSDRDKDSDGRMQEMRENFLPILEDHGVDLVLGGHSHIYERSYLLKGHYGYSEEFDPDHMIIQNDKDKKKNKTAFFKSVNNHGTVYIVCGVSGSRPPIGTCDHPAMAVCTAIYYGSMSIEIHNNVMLVSFIDQSGKVKDRFTLTKDPAGLID